MIRERSPEDPRVMPQSHHRSGRCASLRTMMMTSWPRIAAGLILVALSAFGCATDGPRGTGWITLLDGSAASLNGWDRAGEPANWRSEDGVIVVDKGGEDSSYLVTRGSYKDFQIWAEFWAADDTNSGIFIRASEPKTITPSNAYEVNIYDQRPDPNYGTGAIVDVAKVDPMPKAGGKWNTFLITAKGANMVVVMNGVETVNVNHSAHSAGAIALQFGGGNSGPIKWRKLMVRPL
jgi:hypothetical protein